MKFIAFYTVIRLISFVPYFPVLHFYFCYSFWLVLYFFISLFRWTPSLFNHTASKRFQCRHPTSDGEQSDVHGASSMLSSSIQLLWASGEYRLTLPGPVNSIAYSQHPAASNRDRFYYDLRWLLPLLLLFTLYWTDPCRLNTVNVTVRVIAGDIHFATATHHRRCIDHDLQRQLSM